MSIVLTRATKQAARYTDAGGRERCSGCRFFMPQGTCGRIVGPVSPRGWCKYYSMEAVQRWQPQGAIGFGMGPSLALDFMNPGTMPTGITFTRASTATYFDATGIMQTAAANTPRWDYDPVTHVLRGLLIEEARQNVLLNSANAGNASWIPAGSGVAAPAVTSNQLTAPDGTLTAARVAFPAVPAVGNYSFLNPYTAVPGAGAVITFSVWLRGSVGGEQVALFVTPDGATYFKTMCALTTTWQRFVLTTPALSAVPYFYAIGIDRRDAGQGAAIAQTIYVWGGQVELGAFPTSYIPTTAAAVTRAIELCYMPIGVWFTPSAYSLYFEFDVPAVANVYGGISDAGFDATTSDFANSASNFGVGNTGAPAITANAVSKMCTAINPALFNKLSNNGSAVSTMPMNVANQAAATRISFGNDPWSLSTAFGGHIRRVRCWPRVLSDAEMQSVTT